MNYCSRAISLTTQADITALAQRVSTAEAEATKARSEAMRVQQAAKAQEADLADREDDYKWVVLLGPARAKRERDEGGTEGRLIGHGL